MINYVLLMGLGAILNFCLAFLFFIVLVEGRAEYTKKMDTIRMVLLSIGEVICIIYMLIFGAFVISGIMGNI